METSITKRWTATGSLHFIPLLKIEQFVHHETDKTWIEPVAMHQTNELKMQNYYRAVYYHLGICACIITDQSTKQQVYF